MEHIVEFPGLGISVKVNEVALTLTESYSIRWYGVIIAFGYLLAVLYAWRSAKKMNISMDKLIDAVIAGTIGGIVFARLYYVVFYYDSTGHNRYFENPMDILKIHDGGIAIYGGVIGALLIGGLVAKLRGLRVPAVLDIASLGFLIGQGVGRWGNFINQECFGGPTDLPWGMVSDNTGGIAVHPCFLYESLLCLLGFVLLHIFTRKYRRYDGQTFILYLIWYGIVRFFIEGTRTDSLVLFQGGPKASQLVAAGCVLAGIVMLIVFRNRNNLSGCGDRHVMESVGLIKAEVDPSLRTSTIFGDLPPFYRDRGSADEAEKEDKEDGSRKKQNRKAGE